MTLPRFVAHQPAPGKTVAPQDLVLTEAAVARVLDRITAKTHLDSYLIEGVALTNGIENWIEHGLGRAIMGWTVMDITTAALIYRAAASTADLTRFLPLVTSASTSINLVVF